MNKKIVVSLLATLSLVPVRLVQAQQPTKLPRIGYLSVISSDSNPRTEAFRQGLRDVGRVEGQKIVLDESQQPIVLQVPGAKGHS